MPGACRKQKHASKTAAYITRSKLKLPQLVVYFCKPCSAYHLGNKQAKGKMNRIIQLFEREARQLKALTK